MDVYLLHFEKPLGGDKHQALHYFGSAKDVEARLKEHQKGTSGAYIMEALHYAGVGFYLARVWQGGGRQKERSLKNYHNAAKFCPICNGKVAVPLMTAFDYYPARPVEPEALGEYQARKALEAAEREALRHMADTYPF